MTKTATCATLLILMVLFSCGRGRPDSSSGILSEDKMTELLIDTHLADAILYSDNSKSEDKQYKGLYYYPSILEKNGITKARMDSSVAWYMRHPEAYARIYDRVMKELEKIQMEEKKKEVTE